MTGKQREMWLWLVVALCLGTDGLAQPQYNTGNGGRLEWAWALDPVGNAQNIPPQYYVQIPHNAPLPDIQPTSNGQGQLEFYLLPPQYNTEGQLVQINSNDHNYNPTEYHVQHNYQQSKESKVSTPLRKEEHVEIDHKHDKNKIVHVFDDRNCTDEKRVKTTKLYPPPPTHRTFGTKLSTSYRIDKDSLKPRENSRSERVYMQKQKAPKYYSDGISKLVASTQDLISNEDLLIINHAVEEQTFDNKDDIIKPLPKKPVETRRSNGRSQSTSRVTVKSNAGQLVDSQIDHSEGKTQVTHPDDFFVSPIIVPDMNENDFKEQMTKSIVSSIEPYIEDGYEVTNVKNSVENYSEQTNRDSVTPRPISQKYLAAITVGLRLANSNQTEKNIVEDQDDHEGSDSEIVSDTVEVPQKEETTVEIQKSIPLGITHINEVVVHEWDESKSNRDDFAITKTMYDQFQDALDMSRQIQQNMNKNLYKYGSAHQEGNDIQENTDALEAEENIHTARYQTPDHKRNHYAPYDSKFGEKIIQPIIIEKEVPVTKYVDRFIEKKVPYPEPVEVVKEKPYPVPVPIETIIEKPIEVTRYVDRPQPYPVEVHHQVPVEVKVPYPVEKKVFIDRPVHVPYPVEKLVEKPVVHPVAVPTAVAVPVEVQVPVEKKVYYPVAVEVEKQVEKIVDRPVHVLVEKRVPYPVPYETKVPVPVPIETKVPYDRIVEKPVTITKIVDRPVPVQVPVPHPVPVAVHVPRPYPVDRFIEKKVPYPVHIEKIVEKKVEVPIQVPVPVEKIVEKIVEKPIYLTRYVDKPYPVEKRVPYPVDRIVEKRVPYPVHLPYIEKPVYKVPYEEKPKFPYEFEKPKYQYQFGSQNGPKEPSVQSTAWGKLYASAYQHNSTPMPEFKKSAALKTYLNYVTNSRAYERPENYYGPVPPMDLKNAWGQNYLVEFKLRRADRTPKNLRIEYGGFKPPLVPSTEVDLDGIPVNKEDKS